MRTIILEESTWEKANNEFKNSKLSIIPIGATESHGPHNPLGIESFLVDEIARRINNRMNVIVVPTIPVSYSRGWSEFPGTLWVKPSTLKAYLTEICECLIKNGITHLFFINGHGPNIPIIEEISQGFAEYGVNCAQIDLWRFIGSLSKDLWETKLPLGHSGEIATSVMMAVNKSLVCTEKIYSEYPQEKTLETKYSEIIQYSRARASKPYAFEGDPTKANENKGNIILERCINRLEKYLKIWIDTQ